jgi:hypothetical protein
MPQLDSSPFFSIVLLLYSQFSIVLFLSVIFFLPRFFSIKKIRYIKC